MMLAGVLALVQPFSLAQLSTSISLNSLRD
jgi:hypothetical protein